MKTTHLLVTTGYCAKDFDLAKKLYSWIADLGTTGQACLLVADGVTGEQSKELAAIAKKSFPFVATIPATIKAAHAPNGMFLSAARWIEQCAKFPWLWLEPDCVPLHSNWLSDISDGYMNIPTRFWGAIIKQDKQPNLPRAHLTGCSVYPPDAYSVYEPNDRLLTENVAWDIEMADSVLPRSSNSSLVHHFWGLPDMPPVFVKERQPDSPKNHLIASQFIQKGAALFHRCKDGSLIDVLREPKAPAARKTASKKSPTEPVPTPVVE